jgi:outer membrane murein-binding lipoprotein Lpp
VIISAPPAKLRNLEEAQNEMTVSLRELTERATGHGKFAVVSGLILFLSGCQDSRVTNLEQRVNQLESETRELKSERAADDDAARRTKLEACVEEVSTDFQRNLVSNGTKQRNGSYNVPVPTLAEMQRNKQGKIRECQLQYSPETTLGN